MGCKMKLSIRITGNTRQDILSKLKEFAEEIRIPATNECYTTQIGLRQGSQNDMDYEYTDSHILFADPYEKIVRPNDPLFD